MKFTFYHNNINVLDLKKSIDFYQKALGLTVTRETAAEDGSFKLAFLGDGRPRISWNLPGSVIWTGLTNWAITNHIWQCVQMIWTPHWRFTKR